MKKAQTEMIGLVIIVILITLGMLFAAQFALNDAPEEKIFTRKGLAYSTMNTISVTKFEFDGNKLPGSVLLKNCAGECLISTEADCQYSNLDSCISFESQVSALFAETLDKWGKNYEFTSKLVIGNDPVRDLVTITPEGTNTPCQGKDTDTSNPFPISLELGLIQ